MAMRITKKFKSPFDKQVKHGPIGAQPAKSSNKKVGNKMKTGITAIDRVLARKRKHSVSSETTLLRCIERLANGDDLPEDEIEAVVAASKVPLDEWPALIEQCNMRKGLAAQIDEANEARNEIARLELEQQDDNDELAPIVAAHRERAEKRGRAIKAATRQVHSSDTAENKLRSQIPKWIQAKLQELGSNDSSTGRHDYLAKQLPQLRSTVSLKNALIIEHEETINRLKGRTADWEGQQRANRLRAEVSDIKARIEQLTSQLHQEEKEYQELQKAKHDHISKRDKLYALALEAWPVPEDYEN